MVEGGKESGSALKKVVLILDTLFASDTPMGLAELSQQLDLPRQTVHRVVRQCERRSQDARRYVSARRRPRALVGWLDP